MGAKDKPTCMEALAMIFACALPRVVATVLNASNFALVL